MAITAEIINSLPDRFRPLIAGKMASTIQFELTGPDGGSWHLLIAEGKCRVAQGQAADPDATVTMDAAKFTGINTGEVSAPELFWSGQIQIDGSVESVIALAPVMGWQ